MQPAFSARKSGIMFELDDNLAQGLAPSSPIGEDGKRGHAPPLDLDESAQRAPGEPMYRVPVDAHEQETAGIRGDLDIMAGAFVS
jgi:hypothetical protein